MHVISADVTHFPRSLQRNIPFEDKDLAKILIQNTPQNTREVALSSFIKSWMSFVTWHYPSLDSLHEKVLRMDCQSYLNFSILAFSSSCMSWTARHHSSSPADHPEACTAHLHCPPVNYPFFLFFVLASNNEISLIMGGDIEAACRTDCLMVWVGVCNYKGVYSKIFTSNATAPKFLSF